MARGQALMIIKHCDKPKSNAEHHFQIFMAGTLCDCGHLANTQLCICTRYLCMSLPDPYQALNLGGQKAILANSNAERFEGSLHKGYSAVCISLRHKSSIVIADIHGQ
jgi:hypothetical protein